MSRRAALGLLGAVGLAACTGTSNDGASGSSTATDEVGDRDEVILATVAEHELALVAAYDAALAAQPSLASMLAPLREQHADHAAAVGAASAAPTSASVSLSGTPTSVVAALLAAERQAVLERTQACADAAGGASATLLALIAASEASHVEYLRRGAP